MLARVDREWHAPSGGLDSHLVARDLHALDLDVGWHDDGQLRELGIELRLLLLGEVFVLRLALTAAEADGIEVRAPRARELAGLLVTVSEVQERANTGDRVVARL